MARTVLLPEWLIDGTGAATAVGQAVVVEGERIIAVSPAATLPDDPDATVVRLNGMTLLPGLINNHVHLVLPGDGTPFVPWVDLQSDAALALVAAGNLATSLASGVTTVRDCGGRGTTVFDVRAAQAAGTIPGARVIACGWPLTITGGHTRQFGGEVDGTEGVRVMVRRVIALGADYVKVMASGGGTPGSLPLRPSFAATELRVLVDEAHALGTRVSAHCIATESVLRAVEAGVDMIEHASFADLDGAYRLDPQVVDALARSGIPVTPTLQVARDMVDALPDGPERSSWRERREAHCGIVRALRARGVPLLAGSDAGWRATAFGAFHKELEELTACGLSAVEAVRATTGAVAVALGIDDRGTIAPGMLADLVAVRGDLAADIRRVREVAAVWQGGAERDGRHRTLVPSSPFAGITPP